MKENLRREDINTDNLVKPKKKFPQKKIAKNEIGQRPKIFLTRDREKAEILFFETHLESERNQEEAEMGNHTRRLEGLHKAGGCTGRKESQTGKYLGRRVLSDSNLNL